MTIPLRFKSSLHITTPTKTLARKLSASPSAIESLRTNPTFPLALVDVQRYNAAMLSLIRDDEFELQTETQRTDAKRRLTLGAAVKYEGAAYNIYSNRLGQIILDPVVSVPVSEAWLFKNKKALASVKRGLSQSAAGRGKHLGSFAKHAGD